MPNERFRRASRNAPCKGDGEFTEPGSVPNERFRRARRNAPCQGGSGRPFHRPGRLPRVMTVGQAGDETQLLAFTPQTEPRFDHQPLHPGRRASIPAPNAAADVRRKGVDVGSDDLRLPIQIATAAAESACLIGLIVFSNSQARSFPLSSAKANAVLGCTMPTSRYRRWPDRQFAAQR